jgi:adenine-specific DNA-methyltransferase
VNKEGGYEYRNGKKPESYIKYYFDMFTSKGDLIMDFFMGSGTTQAVALKTGRQFIGVEQLQDTMWNVAVPRLQGVINGDLTGISRDVNWQGGGSFIYAELMEKNRGYLDEVANAENTGKLKEVFQRMQEYGDLDFQVDLKKAEDELHILSLNDQKRLLIQIIDKNQLYYNYSEIEDESVKELLSEEDYHFNQSFYENGGID